MELVQVCLEAAAEIIGSLLLVVAAACGSVAIAKRLHYRWIGAMLMAILAVLVAVTNVLGSHMESMILAFAIASAMLMVLWALFEGQAVQAQAKAQKAPRWNYPALTAQIGERRSPLPNELRQLLRRLALELVTEGMSVHARASYLKRVARACLKD